MRMQADGAVPRESRRLVQTVNPSGLRGAARGASAARGLPNRDQAVPSLAGRRPESP